MSELNKFLPDGWVWKYWNEGKDWYATNPEEDTCLWLADSYGWRQLDLLPPREGGGFQRHRPGDPRPVLPKGTNIDLLYQSGRVLLDQYTAWQRPFDKQGNEKFNIIGWRPHFPRESRPVQYEENFACKPDSEVNGQSREGALTGGDSNDGVESGHRSQTADQPDPYRLTVREQVALKFSDKWESYEYCLEQADAFLKASREGEGQ